MTEIHNIYFVFTSVFTHSTRCRVTYANVHICQVIKNNEALTYTTHTIHTRTYTHTPHVSYVYKIFEKETYYIRQLIANAEWKKTHEIQLVFDWHDDWIPAAVIKCVLEKKNYFSCILKLNVSKRRYRAHGILSRCYRSKCCSSVKFVYLCECV